MRDGFAHEAFKVLGLNVVDNAGDDVALAANCANDDALPARPSHCCRAAFIPMTVLGFSANESFIDLDDTGQLLDILDKSGADFVTHRPSSAG